MDKTIENVPEETMRSLVRYPWPGNIRELQNYVARGVILSTDGNFESVPPEKGEALPVEISNPTLEDKSVKRFSRLVSARIGSSEVRGEPPRDLA